MIQIQREVKANPTFLLPNQISAQLTKSSDWLIVLTQFCRNQPTRYSLWPCKNQLFANLSCNKPE